MCFEHYQPDDIELDEFDPTDCYESIEGMFKKDKGYAPMLFSRSRGFTVPHHWVFQTCSIAIDMVDPDDEDTFPIAAIGGEVIDICKACVMDTRNDFRWGGKSRYGKVQIFVLGRVDVGTEYTHEDFLSFSEWITEQEIENAGLASTTHVQTPWVQPTQRLSDTPRNQ